MSSQLTEELAQKELDSMTKFMLCSAFPEHLTLEAYQAIQDLLILIGLNMSNNDDIVYVDNWSVLGWASA
jgi:hypothetical protein